MDTFRFSYEGPAWLWKDAFAQPSIRRSRIKRTSETIETDPRPQILHRRKHLATDRLLVFTQVFLPARVVLRHVVGERMLRRPNRILRCLAHGYLKVVLVHRSPKQSRATVPQITRHAGSV
jgi:hypothetical protein